MMKTISRLRALLNQPEIAWSQPLFSHGIMLLTFYDELQKNHWASLVEDEPKALAKHIVTTLRKYQVDLPK